MKIVEILVILVLGVVLSALDWGITLTCRRLFDNDDSGG